MIVDKEGLNILSLNVSMNAYGAEMTMTKEVLVIQYINAS